MKIKIIHTFGFGHIAYVDDDPTKVIDEVVFFDDNNEPHTQFAMKLPHTVPTTILLNTKATTLPRQKAFKPTKHSPYLLIGEYDRLYIPLSTTINHEVLPQTTQDQCSGDYTMFFNNLKVQLTNGKESTITIQSISHSKENDQYIKRGKLLKELKECGACSLTDWDLKRILQHYKITKRRTPLE